MKTTVAALAVILVLGLASTAAAQKNKKPVCGPDVYLKVQIIGTPTDPGGNKLVSDGLGQPYDHGSSANVDSRFQVENCTHDFTVNTHNSERSLTAMLSVGEITAHFFNVDRVHSVPVTPESLFTDGGREAWLRSPFCTGGVRRDANGHIVKDTAEGWYYDNYAGCGIDDQGRGYVLRMMGVMMTPDSRLQFNVPRADQTTTCASGSTEPACDASYVRVYHPWSDRWIVRHDGQARAVYTVSSKGRYVFKGWEVVPLEIIADRQ